MANESRIYTEVRFRRIVTRNGEQEGSSITISFERIEVVRELVKCTPEQAEILNRGKLTAPNDEFTYLLAEGESDPQPYVNSPARSGRGPIPDEVWAPFR